MDETEQPQRRTGATRRKTDPVAVDAPVAEAADAVAPDPGVGGSGSEADPGLPVGDAVRPFTWVGVVTTAALALVAVQVLVFLGAFVQGLSVDGLDGDILHKLGVAFLSNLGAVNGLTVVLAAVLAGLPALLKAEVIDLYDRRRSLALSIGSMLALAMILATPIAVRARLRVLDLGNQEVDALARWVLATYTVSTLGTAAVALATCLGVARINRTVTPSS